MTTPHDVPVRDENIRLGQLLKLADLAEGGGHARHLISDGEVQVNGAVETRRGAHVALGDVVTVSGPGGQRSIRVVTTAS